MLGTFKKQPLQLSLKVLDENAVFGVPLRCTSEENVELQYLELGKTTSRRATYSLQPIMYNIQVGQNIMLRGVPCRISQVVLPRGGKIGHPKVWISGRGIFSNKVYEDVFPETGC